MPASRGCFKVRHLAIALGSLLFAAPTFAQKSLPFPAKPSGSKAGPPLSLAYFDRKPFAYNGQIDRLDVKHLK